MKSFEAQIDRRYRQEYKTYLKKISIQKKMLENLADSLTHAGVDLEGATSKIHDLMIRDFKKIAAKRLKVRDLPHDFI